MISISVATKSQFIRVLRRLTLLIVGRRIEKLELNGIQVPWNDCEWVIHVVRALLCPKEYFD